SHAALQQGLGDVGQVLGVEAISADLGGSVSAAGALGEDIGFIAAEMKMLHVTEQVEVFGDPFFQKAADVGVGGAIAVVVVGQFAKCLVLVVLEDVFTVADGLEQGDRLEA